MNDETKEVISVILSNAFAQVAESSSRAGAATEKAQITIRELAHVYNGLLKMITHSSESPSVTIGRWHESNTQLAPWIREGIFATCVVEPDDGPKEFDDFEKPPYQKPPQ